MFDRRHYIRSLPVVFILIAAVLPFVSSCDEQPAGVVMMPEEGDLTGSGEIDPRAGGSFLLGAVSDTILAPGRLEIWAMDIAFDSQSGIVSFDVQLRNMTQRSAYPPIHFVITQTVPPDIMVVEFDGTSWDGFPYYDFSSVLGDDDVLEPGERTDRITMKFHTGTARSFAIGFRIELGTSPGWGMIAGVVYRDDNLNGVRDVCNGCEPGISGIYVLLKKALDGGDKWLLFTRTDMNGEYRFGRLGQGVYEVGVNVPPEMWEVTSTNPLLITLVEGPDGEVQDFLDANFGIFPIHPPDPGNLFGPIPIGPGSPFGTLLDSVFVNPESMLPVIFDFYIDVMEPPYLRPYQAIVDSASAWINDELVFEYHRPDSPDSLFFAPRTILLPEGLVQTGVNTVRLFTDGDEEAVLLWRVYREP